MIGNIYFKTVQQLFTKVFADDCPGLAAEMTYHLIMLSAPGIILTLTLFGLFGHQQDIIDQLFYYADQILPNDILTVLHSLITTIVYGGSRGIAVIGLFSALWSAI